MITISIIIPVYNCGEYLTECIESILKQKTESAKLQLILIDDGSTDNSAEICDNYASKYSEIIVEHQTNQGVSKSRSRGIELATGSYLMFIDGDDLLTYNAIYKLEKILKSDDYDVIRFGAFRFDNKGNKFPFQNKYSKFLQEYRDLLFTKETVPGVCVGIYKSKILKEYNICFDSDLRYGEDWKVAFQILCHTEKFYYLNYELYAYRINPLSATEKKRTHIISDSYIAFNRMCDYAKNNNIEINISVINKAKTNIRYETKKFAIFVRKSYTFAEAEEIMNKYVPQSFFSDLSHSYKFKHYIVFLLYKIIKYFY